ncbi:MAG: DUF1460 domain-containing protein [Chitinophagaceae bacterium]|nr:DUF1460 domain-containing protein [Oligoflexus sp.]
MKVQLFALTLLTMFSMLAHAKPSAVLPIGQSIEKVSESFLGVPYHNDALGEGAGTYDSDPLARTDLFDCTTFVETVWALSFTKDDTDWKSNLQKIRYDHGEISYVKRLHFISVDWMPYHLQRGAVTDLTRLIGGDLVESQTLIDKKAWYEKMHPEQVWLFNQFHPQLKPQVAKIEYVKFETLLEEPAAANRLKAELEKGPLIVNFVRPNWDTVRYIGTKIDISHQGFVLLKGGDVVLRHASAANGRVKDDDFMSYIKAYKMHPALKGVQFVRILTL